MIAIPNLLKKVSLRAASLCAVLFFSANAEVLEVGGQHRYTGPCEAIRDAKPGDVILLSEGIFAGPCALTTPGLTIRGSGTGTVMQVETDQTTLQISADNTVLENLAFAGAAGSVQGTAIGQFGGKLTLRQVQVQGAAIGLLSLEAEGSALTVSQSRINLNGKNIVVGKIDEFSLYDSEVGDATTGNSIDSAAARNNIGNNKLTSRTAENGHAELTIQGGVHSSLTGNLFDREGLGENGVSVQYVGSSDLAGTLSIVGNTFVAGTAGVVFVDAAGAVGLQAQIEKNVFLGGVVDGSLGSDIADRNFLGDAPEFNNNGQAVLKPEGVPSDWGAPLAVHTDATPDSLQRAFSSKTVVNAAAAPVVQSLTLSSTQLVGAGYVKATVNLAAAAPSGGVQVNFSSSNAALAYPQVPAILVSGGSKSGTVIIYVKNASSSSTSATIKASVPGSSASATLSLQPTALKSITLENTEIGSLGKLSLNRVHLTGPAPSGGTVVYLSASNGLVSIPASVRVGGGATSASFTISADPVTARKPVTITAKLSSGQVSTALQVSATLTVAPAGVTAVQAAPTTVAGGQYILLKISLNAPAPAGGLKIQLSSSNTALPLPTTITAAAGSTTGSAVAFTKVVSSKTSVTVKASTESASKSATVTVVP